MAQKNTRRLLMASAVYVIICLAMLVGTTFAWFTDEAVSGNNTIAVGNLDVTLSYRNAQMQDFAEVTDETVDLICDINGEAIEWEPGAAAVTYLKIANSGSLSLKYRLGISAKDSVMGADGAALSKVLKSAVVEIGENEVGSYTRETAVAAARAAGAVGIADYVKEGVMSPQTAEYLAMVVYFPEEVGNIYDGACYNRSDVKLSTEFGVNLFATQTAAEHDGFGNDYDENIVIAYSLDDIEQAIAAANGEPVEIAIASNAVIDVNKTVNIVGEVGFCGGTFDFGKDGMLKIADDADVSLRDVELVGSGSFGAPEQGFDPDADYYTNQLTIGGEVRSSAAISVGAGASVSLGEDVVMSGFASKGYSCISARGSADKRATVNIEGATFTDNVGQSGTIINGDQYTEINIYDGKICGNVSYGNANHGIIRAYSGTIVNMYGGEISGNYYSGNGLIGLWSGSESNPSVLNMYGGKICDNSFMYNKQLNPYGNAGSSNGFYSTIYVHKNSRFNMMGGEISRNYTDDCFYSGIINTINSSIRYSFNMTGGTIKDNTFAWGYYSQNEQGEFDFDGFKAQTFLVTKDDYGSAKYYHISEDADVIGYICHYKSKNGMKLWKK